MTKLRVKTTSNYTFEISVELDDTVADVKRNIENSQGTDFYPADRLVVVHAGKILKDETTTLKENRVTEKSFLVILTLPKKRGLEGDSSDASTSPAKKLPTESKEAAADAGASSTGQSMDSATQTTLPTKTASTGPNVTPLNLFPQDVPRSTTVAEVSTHPCPPAPPTTPVDMFSPDHPSSPRGSFQSKQSKALDDFLQLVVEQLERSQEGADSTPAVARSKQPENIGDFINRMSQGTPSSLKGADSAPTANQSTTAPAEPSSTQSQAAPATGSGTNEPAEGGLGDLNQLTNSERQAVDRLVAMGYSWEDAMKAFLESDKNEERAANHLRFFYVEDR